MEQLRKKIVANVFLDFAACSYGQSRKKSLVAAAHGSLPFAPAVVAIKFPTKS
jgi:hypothetical protein